MAAVSPVQLMYVYCIWVKFLYFGPDSKLSKEIDGVLSIIVFVIDDLCCYAFVD